MKVELWVNDQRLCVWGVTSEGKPGTQCCMLMLISMLLHRAKLVRR